MTLQTRVLVSISVAVLGLSFVSQFEPALGAVPARSEKPVRNKQEANERLKEVEANKAKVLQKLRETKEMERRALNQLHHTERQLNATKEELHSGEQQLEKTERGIKQCERKLTQTKSEEELMAEQAGARLREIYEGQRLGLIEMLFQVSSLQTLLDLFYYQERIAETDRKMLESLRAKAVALAEKKTQLGSKKTVLGDLITQIAEKAQELTRKKSREEIVAEQLRTQRAFYEQAERELEKESRQLERQIVDMCSGTKGKALTQGSGTMRMPLRAPITSPFGMRNHPLFRVRKFHSGIDLAGPNHSPIRSADSGSVIYSGWYSGYGKVAIVSHGKGLSTLYAHMSHVAVREGQSVQKGDVIGYEGSTGYSTGPHLHFEVRVHGKPNNPLNFVRN